MTITVELPDDLATHPEAAREALETFAIEGYRSGALTPYQTRTLLGISTRYEFEEFLKDRGVLEHAYDVADLEQDIATMRQLREQGLLGE
jgi:predicted HTH domain antitoxin